MVKQLIAITTVLLIKNISKTIYYTYAICDFTIITKYLLYDNKTLFYIKYILYNLDQIKILFKNYYSINIKLFLPNFNYTKFYNIIYFVKYI